MLPAANRLRRAADFTETSRRGVRATRGQVVASVLVCPDAPAGTPARVGLVVTRKVGGSVVRHRVSRRLRSAARLVLPELPDGSRVVLRALPGAHEDRRLVSDTGDAIRAALATALARVNR